MASLPSRTQVNGSQYYAVLYRLRGKQTSTSFDDFESANRLCHLVTKFGAENALSTVKVDATLRTLTLEQWLTHHVDHLTGVDANTLGTYRSYIRNDIPRALDPCRWRR